MTDDTGLTQKKTFHFEVSNNELGLVSESDRR